MAVPYTFASATSPIPLSQLDSNFGTTITLGNTAIQLGNTVAQLNNMTFANVTISSVSTAITPAQGGTGLTTVGTSGNVLTSNGTAWLSQAPAAATGNITLGNTTVSLNGTATSVGNLTLANATVTSGAVTANVANSTLDGTNTVGFLAIPQDAQTGNYTLVAADAGKHIYHASGAAAATYTIPANSSVSYATGTAISFVNMSANAVTISITTDTLYLSSAGTTGNRTLAQYGVATALKLTGTTWIISGSGLT